MCVFEIHTMCLNSIIIAHGLRYFFLFVFNFSNPFVWIKWITKSRTSITKNTHPKKEKNGFARFHLILSRFRFVLVFVLLYWISSCHINSIKKCFHHFCLGLVFRLLLSADTQSSCCKSFFSTEFVWMFGVVYNIHKILSIYICIIHSIHKSGHLFVILYYWVNHTTNLRFIMRSRKQYI